MRVFIDSFGLQIVMEYEACDDGAVVVFSIKDRFRIKAFLPILIVATISSVAQKE